MFDLSSSFFGQHLLLFLGLLFLTGLFVGIFGTLLIRDCLSYNSIDEMDEIPVEKEKEELIVCY